MSEGAGDRSLLARGRAWFKGLSPLWAGLLILAVAGGLTLAGKQLYDTYYYVQHENEFCLSCHLMEGPYQKFAESAHRGLSCKACHQPTLVQRGRMGLAQVLEQPEEVRAHADVPNERCAACHIEGDPEEWRQIENTAGHRAHLESDSLSGLQCVQCHSTSLHRFVPPKETCAQSGCHEETEVRLGGMGQLTVHCIACHEFTRPAAAGAASADTGRGGLLRPKREQCLSCHAMRVMLTDFPRDDPHDAECGACHDPHEQATPGEAVTSCYSGGCHADLDTANYFHHRLESSIVRECTRCHTAHDFEVEETRCRDCHEEIFRRGGSTTSAGSTGSPENAAPSSDEDAGAQRGVSSSTVPPRAPPHSREGHPPVSLPPAPTSPRTGGPADPFLSARPGPARAAVATSGGEAAGPAGAVREEVVDGASQDAPAAGRDTVPFTHSDHQELDCLTCHRTGSPTVQRERGWCAECHHREASAESCTRCHGRERIRSPTYSVERTYSFSTGDERTREVGFNHAAHGGLVCTTCHSGRPQLSAAGVECAECHDDHHQVENSCVSCHEEAPAEAHPLKVHLTCSGSWCHDPAPFRASTRERNLCVACHQEQVDHQTGQNCVRCHVLPPARAHGDGTGDTGEVPAGSGTRREDR